MGGKALDEIEMGEEKVAWMNRDVAGVATIKTGKGEAPYIGDAMRTSGREATMNGAEIETGTTVEAGMAIKDGVLVEIDATGIA